MMTRQFGSTFLLVVRMRRSASWALSSSSGLTSGYDDGCGVCRLPRRFGSIDGGLCFDPRRMIPPISALISLCSSFSFRFDLVCQIDHCLWAAAPGFCCRPKSFFVGYFFLVPAFSEIFRLLFFRSRCPALHLRPLPWHWTVLRWLHLSLLFLGFPPGERLMLLLSSFSSTLPKIRLLVLA